MPPANVNRPLKQLSKEQLTNTIARLSSQYEEIKTAGLALDLTRGKPSQNQIELCARLDGILAGNFKLQDGTDARNYGGIAGIPEARALGAEVLNAKPEEVIAGGSSSLTMMYQYVEAAYFFGLFAQGPGWLAEAASKNGKIKFLCPVPGYDRHFTICEALGIEMIPVPMKDDGPDINVIQTAVQNDALIKGIWCVPRFSNPSGECYSDAVVAALAALPAQAGPNFRILWDNAYSVHDFYADGPTIAPLLKIATELGHADHVVMLASTSKITFAGGGISWLATSPAGVAAFLKRHGTMSIGPDKVNQLRHVRLLPDLAAIKALMRHHAAILRPKFEAIQQRLNDDLSGLEIAEWTQPGGGYFVSFNCLPGLAGKIVSLTAEAGVKLTAAGATWPYNNNPEDNNIRLAPSFPTLEEIKEAIGIFTLCVRLATARHLLGDNTA